MQETIENAVTEAGYAGIAIVMAIETVFPPIPSELVLPLAGFHVARGTLGFVPALGASTLGAVVGALVLYTIARMGGRPLVLRLHPLLRITDLDLDRADRWFDRRAVPTRHRPAGPCLSVPLPTLLRKRGFNTSGRSLAFATG